MLSQILTLSFLLICGEADRRRGSWRESPWIHLSSLLKAGWHRGCSWGTLGLLRACFWRQDMGKRISNLTSSLTEPPSVCLSSDCTDQPVHFALPGGSGQAQESLFCLAAIWECRGGHQQTPWALLSLCIPAKEDRNCRQTITLAELPNMSI